MRSLWDRWLQKIGEEISPWVGLSFGGLYLGAVAAVGIAAIYVQRAELTRQHLEDAKHWTHLLSRHLACVQADEPETLAREVYRASREKGITFCAVVSPENVITAHSDPTKISRPAEKLSWSNSEAFQVRVAADPNHPDANILASRIISSSGLATNNELRVGWAPVTIPWSQSDLVFWSGYILLVVMSLYLLMYRLLRRSVQSLAVIRRRLLGCNAPLTEHLVALRLNDSFDQISTSWNRLIEFVSEMQEQLRRSKLTTDVTAAMDGYRSEWLTNVLMQIPFGVLVVEADQTISFANRSASGMLGVSGEQLEGTLISTLFDESLRMTLLSAQRTTRPGQAPTSRWTDHVFKHSHGEVVIRFWSIPLEKNATSKNGGEEAGHILFVQDVTQAKEAERARDQFLYHVTHELRTPLTNIRAYAETLSQGVIDDEQTTRECYNVIMGETRRLNRLVEDILNVSQLEVGTAKLEIHEVQIDQLLRKVVQDSQAEADAKNIDLVLNLPAKLPKVRGDRERLAVVMTNLIGNAIKYTPDGGGVDVRSTAENENVKINVGDTGIGIDPADQESIFDKFYRAKDERVSAIPGTGLGLAIAKETIRLHGGSIFVESTPGKGSTFTVVLPAIPIDESASGTRPHVDLSREKA